MRDFNDVNVKVKQVQSFLLPELGTPSIMTTLKNGIFCHEIL